MATRVDFRHVRTHASFQTVLGAYGLELTKDGSRPGQFKALCPFHDDHRPSLKINIEKNLFHCFSCDAAGNVLDFVARMDGSDLRAAALKVAELCGLAPTPGGTPGRRRTPKAPPFPAPAASPAPDPEPPEVTENRPLSFSLKLERPPELLAWLTERGIDAGMAEAWGLGLASRKSKAIGGRLAIPLHNAGGELIGYCGRHPADEIPEDTPKYVLPKGFRKEIEVFNLHQVSPKASKGTVVIVESFFSVIRHYPRLPVVSLMGRSISDAQIERLAAAGFRRALIAFDGDEPGRSGAAAVAGTLSRRLWTRIVDLPDGAKPHHLATEAFHDLLKSCW